MWEGPLAPTEGEGSFVFVRGFGVVGVVVFLLLVSNST
jgi:hypothetical protein